MKAAIAAIAAMVFMALGYVAGRGVGYRHGQYDVLVKYKALAAEKEESQ